MRLERVFVNLDADRIRRLLHSIVLHFEGGFSPQEVDEFCARLESEHYREDLLVEPIVRFQGQDLPFVVDVLDEEPGAFEIVFMTSPAMSQLVQRQIEAECSGFTPKVIPA